MIKKITTGFALMVSAVAFSQVGIQTENPQATLDVVGSPLNASSLDGIIAPRLTGAQLRAKNYTSNQTGTLVYVTAADPAPAGQTIDVTAAGYYYFNGTKWVTTGGNDMNIYKDDGSLTSDRTVNLNGKGLTFQGSEGYFGLEEVGSYATLHGTTNISNLRFSTDDLDGDGITSLFDMTLFADNYLQMLATGEMNGISFGTHLTQNTSPIEFFTSPGGFVPGQARMTITGEGNVGINNSSPTEKFHVSGNARLQNLPLNGTTNAIYTTPGGGASPTQNQTFTATKTVVADANGVLGTVAYLPPVPVVLAGADGVDAVSGSHTIKSIGGDTTTTTLTQRTFTITKKSLVTFFFTAGAAYIEKYGGGGFMVDGVNKQIGAFLAFSAVPVGSSYAVGYNIVSDTFPFSTSASEYYVSGIFYLNGSVPLILEPGNYTVDLKGFAFTAAADSDGVKVIFDGPGDRLSIIAIPMG